ncbi:hypothetical protein WIS52_05620 [Pseudonocardia nematodicida]|uniref:DUF222 domain-containing protein n=1 Tax=Pseudonocardia nematodicida TaxID=1206997 RepID=A0ABV1K639_9PSEU
MRIGGLLVALADAEADGLALPEPLGGRQALDAWARIARPVLAAAGASADAPESVFSVTAEDMATLRAAADLLARRLLRDRRRRAGHGSVAAVLHREAEVHGLPAERLVAELGRAVRLIAPHAAEPPGSTARPALGMHDGSRRLAYRQTVYTGSPAARRPCPAGAATATSDPATWQTRPHNAAQPRPPVSPR